MAPKKSTTSRNPAESSRRGSASRTTRSAATPTPLEPEFYHLTMTDPKHRAQFASLFGRGFEITRFADRPSLEALGVWDDIDRLFQSIGWSFILNMDAPTHIKQTVEILSTLQVKCKNKNQPISITFQLDSTPRSLTKDEVNDIFRCPRGGAYVSPSELYDRDAFWRHITLEEANFAPGYAKVSQIRNPIFRIIQRILGHTVFSRHESTNVRVEELHVLWSMLTNTHVDLGHYLLKQLKSITSKDGGRICLGGVLTPIIAHFLGPRQETLSYIDGDRQLDITYFFRMRILASREPPFAFTQRTGPDFPLPNSELTTWYTSYLLL